jgi:hypothetical protein
MAGQAIAFVEVVRQFSTAIDSRLRFRARVPVRGRGGHYRHREQQLHGVGATEPR